MSNFTFHQARDPRPPFNINHIQAQHNLPFFINLHSLAPPPCTTCSRPSTLTTVHPDNPNNNGGRPYYRCTECSWGKQFITWADAKGFSPDNMKCDCGFGSRLDYVGVSHGVEKQGRKFWTCATGACGFFSWGEGSINMKTEEGDSDSDSDSDSETEGRASEVGVKVKDENEDKGFRFDDPFAVLGV